MIKLKGRNYLYMKKRKFVDWVVIVLLIGLLTVAGVMYVKGNNRERPFFYIENATGKEAVVEVTYYLFQDEMTKEPYRTDTIKYTVKGYQTVECIPPSASRATHVIRWTAELKTSGLLIGATKGNLYGAEAFNQYIVLTEE